MLGKVFLISLLGVCSGSIFEQSLKFSPLRKGIHRFAMDIPKQTQKLESVVDQLDGSPNLLDKLEKLKKALLLRGQPLGDFSPDALLPLSGSQPSSGHKNEASPSSVTLQSYSIKKCSNTEQYTFIIEQLLLKPDPVSLPGQLNFTFNIRVTEDIENLDAALDLRKKFGSSYIKIPCVGVYGSCDYDVCEQLEPVQPCPKQLEDIKFDCKCPIKKGSYISKDIPAVIEAKVFPSGDYIVIANMTTQVGSGYGKVKQAGCYNITLTLA